MSEIEQLTQQKQEIEKSQAISNQWVQLKKNLSSKFKNPADAFKSLCKEGKDVLAIEDFGDYAKGLDLTQVFKDITLNEENFSKAWEQWEYKYKQNDHKLQIINEKLQLLTMLDNGEMPKEASRGLDTAPNKRVQSIANNCETLEKLQEKLDSLVNEGQKQKEKQDVVQNEQDCFAQFLAKKSEVKQPELHVTKLQQKNNEEEEGSNPSKAKRSYIDSTYSYSRNKGAYGSTGNLLQSSLQNKGSLGNSQISLKSSFIIESQIQISPQKAAQNLKNYVPNPQQQLKSPYEERQVLEERKSQKANRMKGDLQNYISDLFQNEREQRQQIRTFEKPSSQGLAGFVTSKRLYQNASNKQSFVDNDSQNVSKRVQTIRYKLDDFQSQKLAQYSYVPRTVPDWTPDRPVRLSNPKPKQPSPKYTSGNTHRLNLNYLKQEKEKESHEQKQEEQPQANC
ncbi:unnamed protein product (macronuclear) [Paramecium tetraurelia]|uniref:Uncharacterized protein n=1 Tax=Paramecium tetraurelia TaxID=5888 RepID=A0DRC9_PARTE|nr:uncharacterized protein GSPATT00019313001 [Paramecium tetraurelia]CAK85596.1 unnamed protein product [Paramecium tetraurelia]|eukprot:XP_001452993.1 hypothetical protein (macronuclear) [Paramecium tetraurelia strain d4-2]